MTFNSAFIGEETLLCERLRNIQKINLSSTSNSSRYCPIAYSYASRSLVRKA